MKMILHQEAICVIFRVWNKSIDIIFFNDSISSLRLGVKQQDLFADQSRRRKTLISNHPQDVL